MTSLTVSRGATIVVDEGRVWDLVRWMPGAADFHANPNAARLANACTALAELHRAWRPIAPDSAACPAIVRRLRAVRDWQSHRSAFASIRDPRLGRAVEAVSRLAGPAERALLARASTPMSVQPCLCDVWHEHVLFTGDAVAGIIDYGAMKVDHVAVDLARMLGDFAGEDDARFERGLAAYREAAGGSLDVSDAFVRMLDRTGILCGAIVWLLRLCIEKRTFGDAKTVENRVARLAARLESIRHF